MTVGADTFELHDIRKQYGETVALAGASLTARAGALHMLLGENGAGKTTLLQIASGLTHADGGRIVHGGRPVQWRTRADAHRAGISIVQQHFSLVPAMTVAENVALADRGMFATYSPRAAASRVERIGAVSGLRVDPTAVVGTLPVAAQQRVEIAKAIAHDAPVLILDEPTAVLSPSEADSLFAWLRTFAASGHTVIVITHRIREAMRHGDAITVLRGGRTVYTAAGPFSDERPILEAILGEPRQDGTAGPAARGAAPDRPPLSREPAMSLRDVSLTDARGVALLRNVSCDIHRGEIVGIAGVEGAGHRDLLRIMAGRIQPSTGRFTPAHRVGFIPEDRHRDALIPGFSLVENFALRDSGERRGLMPWPRLRQDTVAAMQRAKVRAESPDSAASSLSGGNQQRFVFARETAAAPDLIVAENPTRGLDVRAAAEMVARLREARELGAAVVIYSSDLDDIVSLADRVLVCYSGTVREVPVSADAIGPAMVGAS